MSLTATGGSFTGVMLMLMVAGADCMSPSLATNVKLSLPVAFRVAVDAVTSVAAPVTIVGAFNVVNDCTVPNDLPTMFSTIAQKKYVVPAERPVTNCEYDAALVPLPSAEPSVAGARVPKVSSHVPGFVVE